MNAFLLLPARRGASVALGIAVALPAAYVGRRDEWLGNWSETHQHVAAAFLFGIPVALGVAAWAGVAHRRAGLEELGATAARTPTAVAAREIAEVSAWALAGLVLGALPAYLVTALTAVNGRPELLPAIRLSACVAGCVAIGWCAGTRLGWWLIAPVLTVTAYGTLGFFSFLAEPVLLGLTPIDERWMTFNRIAWWVLALQTAFWLLLLLHAVARRARRPWTATWVLVTASLVTVPLLLVSPATRTLRVHEFEMRCAPAGALTLCLPRGEEVLRGGLERELKRSTRLLAGLLPDGAVFLDDHAAGLSGRADRDLADRVRSLVGAGRTVIRFTEAGGLGARARLDATGFHLGLVQFLVALPPPVPMPARGRPEATPTDVVWRWYFEALEVPIDRTADPGMPLLGDDFLDYRAHRAAMSWLAGLDDVSRKAWFEEHAAALKEGSLEWPAFGGEPSDG